MITPEQHEQLLIELIDGTPHAVECPHCKVRFAVLPCRGMRAGSNYGVTYCPSCTEKFAMRCLADSAAMESAPLDVDGVAFQWFVESQRPAQPLHPALEPVP